MEWVIRVVRNHILKIMAAGLVLLLLGACSNRESQLLDVRHFHLQSVDPVDYQSAMARGDQLYRLRGAVTLEEREARLGHYYTVAWRNDQPGTGDLKVVMDYQQAATASKTLRMSHKVSGEEESGKVEFKIAGEDYRVGGTVLAWRVRLMRGERVIAEDNSYLWR